jgi:hypothetical protein
MNLKPSLSIPGMTLQFERLASHGWKTKINTILGLEATLEAYLKVDRNSQIATLF